MINNDRFVTLNLKLSLVALAKQAEARMYKWGYINISFCSRKEMMIRIKRNPHVKRKYLPATYFKVLIFRYVNNWYMNKEKGNFIKNGEKHGMIFQRLTNNSNTNVKNFLHNFSPGKGK